MSENSKTNEMKEHMTMAEGFATLEKVIADGFASIKKEIADGFAAIKAELKSSNTHNVKG